MVTTKLIVFFVAKDFSLGAKSKTPFSFTWKVPTYSQTGEYKVVTYFIVDKKFNLLGLSFTDDIAGNTFDFEVKDGTTGGVFFDKNNTLVDNAPYHSATFIPEVEGSAPVTVSATVVNTTKQKAATSLSWQTCDWDNLSEKKCSVLGTQIITLEPGEKKIVSRSIEKRSQAVSYVTLTAKWQDVTSILNVRFVRKNIESSRLNFLTLTSFPLKKGVETTVLACAHASGTASLVPNSKIILTISDPKGREIFSHTYTGNVTSEIMGVGIPFVPKENLDSLTLSAKLYQGSTLLDESSLLYDCKNTDSTLCLTQEKKPIILRALFWGLILVCGVVGGAIFLLQRTGKTKRKK